MRKFTFVWLAVAIVAVGLLRLPTTASADGDETLGPPSIAIASGSGVAAAGVGLALAQPGVIELEVPAGTVVMQVLLYWEGQATSEAALDDTIVINGIDVTGLRIGGPDFFFSSGGVGIGSATYRADITGLGLVAAGLNILTVGGLSFDFVSNGAGVMAIYSNGTDGGIQLVDGNDLAFVDFPAPRDTTVAQTFVFASDFVERTATVDMFFSSAAGLASTGGAFRPSVIDVFVDGLLTNEIHNAIISADGEEWDTLTVAVTIPAGATSVTIHPQSEDRLVTGANPASFAWNAASFSLPGALPPPPPPDDEPPLVLDVVASPNPVEINVPINLTAIIDDTGLGDSIIVSAEYQIDGGTFIGMSASDSSFDEVTEDVTAAVGAFAQPDVHTFCVRGTDAAGNVGAVQCTFVAVYDPASGFVTGGGWIDSPAGAYTADPSMTGKASFGFVSKCRKGASIPTGQTQFEFRAGDLNFQSSSYDWLVIAGARAQFKGVGTINGTGNYASCSPPSTVLCPAAVTVTGSE